MIFMCFEEFTVPIKLKASCIGYTYLNVHQKEFTAPIKLKASCIDYTYLIVQQMQCMEMSRERQFALHV